MEQWRTNFFAAMNWYGHGASVLVIPSCVTSFMPSKSETQDSSNALKFTRPWH